MISIYGFKRVLICFLIISANFTVWAQDKPTSGDTLKNLINATFANETAKLFVHYDKTVYLPNETIWFTAYLLNNDTLTNKADILSVALVKNSDRTIAIQKKFVITGAGSSGSILIPDTILAGDYSIIAYTNHFVKGRPEALFIQRIAIKRLEQPDPKVQPKPAQRPALTRADSAKISIKFYPEGGDMVANLPQYVGWEAKDGTGALLKLNVVLLKDEDVIDTISTSAYGLGKFFINPKPGSRYAVKVIGAENQSLFNLPSANERGITLTMPSAMVHDTLFFKVAGTLIGKIHIAVHNNRQIFYVLTDIDLQKQNTFKIALDSLPRGLAAITIYNENLRPCAERVFFAHYDKAPAFYIISDQPTYGKRKKVVLHLGFNSSDSKQGVVSVACVRANRINRKDFNDIETFAYLDNALNDLPLSFENSSSSQAKKYLEDFLLVRGWRRYLTVTPINNLVRIETPLQFSGRVNIDNRPIKKPIMLMLFGESVTKTILTDSTGKFTLPNADLVTSRKKQLTLMAAGGNTEGIHIALVDPYESLNRQIAKSPIFDGTNLVFLNTHTSFLTSVFDNRVMLKQVTVRGQKNSEYDGTRRPSGANKCGDYVCVEGILNCPRYIHKFGKTHPPIEGKTYFLPQGGIILYDGCQVTNQSTTHFDGINVKKEFYPYTESDITISEPLYENTLLWKNQINLEGNKETTLTFYTGDIKAGYTIVAQGITDNGVVFGEQHFEVE